MLLAFVSFLTLKAQEGNKDCKFEFKVSLEKEIENEVKSIYKAQILWDFSKLDLKDVICIVEIVPIKDCVNELEAIKLKPSILISSKDANFSVKGSKYINHLELMSKCIKWRVVITDAKASCFEVTDWKYSSFLSQQ